MQEVFTNTEVVAKWATRTEDKGRNKRGNLFFEGGILYSYGRHCIAARFMSNDNGDQAVFINDSDFSVTSNGHANIAMFMTSDYKQFFSTDTDYYLVKEKLDYLLGEAEKDKGNDSYAKSAVEVYTKYNEHREWCGGYEKKANMILKRIVGKISRLGGSPFA